MTTRSAPKATMLYGAPAGMRRPFRVVMVAPESVPSWMSTFRDRADECEWMDVIVLPVVASHAPMVARVPILVRASIVLEALLLGKERSLERVSLAPSAGAFPGPTSDLAAVADAVGALDPDLVILLGPDTWSAGLAKAATYGCWRMDAELVDVRYAGVRLLSPMLRGAPTTHMGITLADGGGPPTELSGSVGQTRAGSFSRQRDAAFRKLPGLLLRAVRRLASGELHMARHSAGTLSLSPQPELGRLPGARAMALLAKAAVRRVIGRRRDGRSGWTLVLRLAGAPLDPEDPIVGSHALLRPASGWWADPFIVNADGRKLIFVEEMADRRINNANIACVELAEGGARRLGLALDESGHLSYPQVFHWQGEWYMTVESSYDRRVSLYKAMHFPLGWSRSKDLIQGRVCVDPTLHFQDGHWYLFANVAENGTCTSDELFLFVSDKLEGEYLPHPASPLVCDVRRARMAGKLFWHHGRLIRPAQDCGPSYGSAVVFNEVVEISPTTYAERPLSKLTPHFTRRVAGCHTYNADGQMEILDVFGRPPNSTAYLTVVDAVAGGGDHPPQPKGTLWTVNPTARAPTGDLGLPAPGSQRHGRKYGPAQGPQA